jgi:hypothetical protein
VKYTLHHELWFRLESAGNLLSIDLNIASSTFSRAASFNLKGIMLGALPSPHTILAVEIGSGIDSSAQRLRINEIIVSF